MKLYELLAVHRLYGKMKGKSKLDSLDIRILIWLSTQDLPKGIGQIEKGMFYKQDPTIPSATKKILYKMKERGLVAEYQNFPHNIFSITKAGRDMIIVFESVLNRLADEGVFEKERHETSG